MKRIRARFAISILLIILIPMLLYLLGVWRHSDSRAAMQLMATGIAVLVIVSVSLYVWVNDELIRPLIRLQKAMKEIREGNLDYTLDSEGAETETEKLLEDFEEMRIRLKENQEEKLQSDRDSKELISNISHDLKTPITAIKGYVEGIMDGVASSPEKLDRYIRTIYNKANDMDRLIDELMFYSKIDTNRIPYHFEKLRIEAFFRDCAEETGLEMENRNVAFSYESNVREDVLVIADVEQLRRVVNNIIGNSLKYGDKPQQVIILRLRDDGDFVRAEIEDNGCGISREDLPNIFNRFFRTDHSRSTEKGGSGIGLSIVRKIIEDHGGRVWAKSTPGVGTTILFSLRKYTGGEELK